jgi:hypothetical protein
MRQLTCSEEPVLNTQSIILRNLNKAVVMRCYQSSVFAVEGLFKGLEKINEYITLRGEPAYSNIESESAW